MHGSHNSNHVERGVKNLEYRHRLGFSARLASKVNNLYKKIRAKKRRNFKSDETPSF